MISQLDLHELSKALLSARAAIKDLKETLEVCEEKLSCEQKKEIPRNYQAATEEGIGRLNGILASLSKLLAKAEKKEGLGKEEICSLLDDMHRLIVAPPSPRPSAEE